MPEWGNVMIVDLDNAWRQKAQAIISLECARAYTAANKGKKRHVPYRVPEIAEALIKALDKNDEHEVKRLFHIYHTGALSLI